MKFNDILTEKFKNTFEVRPFVGTKTVQAEVFEDPSTKEIMDLLKISSSYKGVRLGIVDKSNPTIYAWRADVLHSVMLKHIKFDLPVIFNPFDDVEFQINDIAGHHFKGFDRFKNKKGLYKKLLKFIPGANYSGEIQVDVTDGSRPRYFDMKTGKEVN